MITLISSDPIQWKLTVIFLTLLWLGFSVWLNGRRMARIQSQLRTLELAKGKTAWTASDGSAKGKVMS